MTLKNALAQIFVCVLSAPVTFTIPLHTEYSERILCKSLRIYATTAELAADTISLFL